MGVGETRVCNTLPHNISMPGLKQIPSLSLTWYATMSQTSHIKIHFLV